MQSLREWNHGRRLHRYATVLILTSGPVYTVARVSRVLRCNGNVGRRPWIGTTSAAETACMCIGPLPVPESPYG